MVLAHARGIPYLSHDHSNDMKHSLPYPLYDLLFIDVETVSEKAAYDELDETTRNLWKEKARYWMKEYPEEEEGARATYQSRAAILAEFGRVLCISVGYLTRGETPAEDVLRLKSWCSADERQVLEPFSALLETPFGHPQSHMLCGHNIREFDVPYLCRRLLMNQMGLPPMLDVAGKRPWEVKHLIDTMELWKFGDIKHYTSLKLLSHCLDIPSPKDDISGADVGRVFYEEQGAERIVDYCEGDVLAVVQVMRRFCQLPLLAEEQVLKAG